MKKGLFILGLFVVVIIGIFALLLSGTGPDDANSQPVEVTLEDNFER